MLVAGQVAEDTGGNQAGPDDFPTQARQVFANLGRALADAGASPDQAARLGIFVVGSAKVILRRRGGLSGAVRRDRKAVDTLLGVQTLAHRGYLLEVEAIVVIDGW